ncbi:hypothetical protein [Bradyrhizobium paxllaeri]|uniref:hypothetical protein n=1 Tax=Bradyrhizobium paxllaeri TaxID=190148 RepID=UPI0011464A52|nr:hypothetical protein [Bradyrhizobium paxllaeri]
MSGQRIHATANPEFFHSFVSRYPDKQYQTWLGRHWIKVGVDYDYDEQLKTKIAAAIVSHFSDVSFASALKTMNERSGPKAPAGIPRFENIVDFAETRFHSTSLHFLQQTRPNGIVKEEYSGVIHAELFLLRLLTSFEAARRLINWGFFAEPLTILRSSLEQLSWAYAVGVKFDRKGSSKSDLPPRGYFTAHCRGFPTWNLRHKSILLFARRRALRWCSSRSNSSSLGYFSICFC